MPAGEVRPIHGPSPRARSDEPRAASGGPRIPDADSRILNPESCRLRATSHERRATSGKPRATSGEPRATSGEPGATSGEERATSDEPRAVNPGRRFPIPAVRRPARLWRVPRSPFPVPWPARLWRVPRSRPSAAVCRFGSSLPPGLPACGLCVRSPALPLFSFSLCIPHSALRTPHSALRTLNSCSRLTLRPRVSPGFRFSASLLLIVYLSTAPKVIHNGVWPFVHVKTIKFGSKSIKKATFSVKKGSKRRAFRHAHLNILGGHPLWR
jgi:hypothetical protein